MADRNRRFTLAAIALPLLFLATSGLARANEIVVNTTSGESEPFPLCSLPDAITAHNIHGTMNGCGPGTSSDTIVFGVTGTISIDESLEITSGTLEIDGPIFGCSGAGPCGITIDGEGSVQIIHAEPAANIILNTLTLADGFGVTEAPNTGGGAIFTIGNNLEINDCLFVNNKAAGVDSTIGGEGGAIYAGVEGLVTIVNSTFANNTAVHGSSIPSEGGAISAEGDNLRITNVTFSGNSADTAGGIDIGLGSVRLKNTILANNTGGNCSSAPTDLGANISDDSSCAFSVAPFRNNTNPLLEPLANNGGPTDTFALETSPSVSPAIDLVSLAKCTDQSFPTPQPLETDQRLFSRPDPGNPNACDSGAYEAGAIGPYTLNSERVQVARSPSPNSDQVNIGMTFTANGDPDCDLGPIGDEDALNFGVGVALIQGTCAQLPDSGLFLNLFPFVVHTVNHQQYGTLFQSSPPDILQQSTETVSARLVALKAPTNTCGQWTLNLEVAGLNTTALGLGGGNPFAILITDFDDAEACFDVTNAIVGNQIPTPGHGVRRGVRRQTRR
jgi:hypothetical protein